jgi:hypothetical protein
MKKTILILLAVTVTVLACKKSEYQKTTAEKVLGKWNFSGELDTLYNNGTTQTKYLTGTVLDSIDLRTDGKAYIHIQNNYDTFTYKVVSDTRMLVNTDTSTIKTLTDNLFVIYIKGGTATQWYSNLVILKR